jgi:hypothetical protein
MEKYLNMVFLRISSEYRDLHVDGSVLHELPTGFNRRQTVKSRTIRDKKPISSRDTSPNACPVSNTQGASDEEKPD